MREQLLPVLAGLAAGTLLSAWNVRLLESRLYQLSVYDPWVWGAATTVVLAAAISGALLPALRASRANPVDAVRVD
jgi:ABC-type antimicrobial peptide transport system permease subunit